MKPQFDRRDWYNAKKTISYNADLTMVITMRSYGKTYGFIKEAIRDYMRDRSQFVLVRRYDTELKEAFPKVFDSMIEHREFPGWEFKTEGSTGYARKMNKKGDGKWDVICHGIPLSKQANYKGTEFPRVKKIIFDEFIRVLKTPPGYLRDDVGAFLDLLKTISRDRTGVHAYLLGNACDLTCPYLAFVGIKTEPRQGYTWYKNKSILVHYDWNEHFAEQEFETMVGRLVKGTNYANVMIMNEFANAGDEFIMKKTKAAKFRYGVKYQGYKFGVWVDLSEGLYFINNQIPNGEQRIYALSTSDMAPNLIMIDQFAPFSKSLVRLFGSGCLRFDSQATRENFVKMMAFCGLR